MDPSLASVFKAYDIRGRSPGQIDAQFAERLGCVLADLYHPKRVMIGRDMRSTSPELEAALVKGLTDQGADVVKIGLCSTPMFNVSVGLANGAYDLGVMITASHNPGEYNGIKLVDGNVFPIGEGSGMEQIRDRFLSDEPFASSKRKGSVEEDADALRAYLDRIFSLADVSKIPVMKVAVDAGNGMAGVILPEFIKRIPQVTVLPLYWEPDGTFPNHEANPLKTETLADLSALVTKESCACGAAFDGDADRAGFVDENGAVVPGDFMTAVLAEALLRANPGALALYDLRCSWSVKEEIERAGGKADMMRVGHSFIKRRMRETGALFAGELSMHYYFKDLWGVESGDLAMLLLLIELAESGKKLSELWKPLKKYAYSGEINSKVRDADAVLARIEEAYASAVSSVSHLDGIRMEFGVSQDGTKEDDAWWFSVRRSNTEPLVRLIVEAVREDVMIAKRDELLALIRS
jgi:phosphomannomutase